MNTTTETITSPTIEIKQSRCPQCEELSVTSSDQRYEYVHGTGESAVRLWVTIPVYKCGQCEYEFTDWKANVIRKRALCEHFGVLSPHEVRQVRKEHQLTRRDFARLTGIGEASLSRWEKGINIQSFAYDRYLRLLSTPPVFEHLKRIVYDLDRVDRDPPDNIVSFPNLSTRGEANEDLQSFWLRSAV